MRISTPYLAALALATVFPAGALHSQTRVPAAVGERVRITTPEQRGPFRVVGRVTSVQGDSITLFSDGTDGSRPIAAVRITRLEVSAGTETHARDGMLYGSMIGAGGGALIGLASYKKPKCDVMSFFGCPDPGRGGEALIGALVGGVLGVAVGGVYGAMHRTERWIDRPLGMPGGVSFVPSANGAGVSVRLKF